MRTILIAWNEAGDILATLDAIARDGKFVDLLAEEAAGVRMRTLWTVAGAIASGTWPDNGTPVARCRVEVDWSQPHPVRALIDRDTGERIERP